MTDRRPVSVTRSGGDKMDGAVDEVKLLDIDWSVEVCEETTSHTYFKDAPT